MSSPLPSFFVHFRPFSSGLDWTPYRSRPGLDSDKAKGKVKEKEVATSPRGGEKCKKKKTAAKVANDNDNIVEVPGPSGKQSGFDPGPFLE